ncbi:MAG TPA: hypothetical protein VNO35_32645, partial [Steroidobacteraceae bacterium]|nr:hypothetical protein [Steroidobacteraceae bacterium]
APLLRFAVLALALLPVMSPSEVVGLQTNHADDANLRMLYLQLQDGWNRGSGAAFASAFCEHADLIVPGGLQIKGRERIAIDGLIGSPVYAQISLFVANESCVSNGDRTVHAVFDETARDGLRTERRNLAYMDGGDERVVGSLWHGSDRPSPRQRVIYSATRQPRQPHVQCCRM